MKIIKRWAIILVSVVVVSILVGIFVSMLVTKFSPKNKKPGSTTLSLTPQAVKPTSTISYKESVVSLISEEEKNELVEEKKTILPKLPIYIKGFKTKSGKVTTINIFSSPYDPPETLRIEIYGVNYLDGIADENDPNYSAFVESLKKAFEEIDKAGGDSTKLRYIFYSKEIFHEIASAWAKNAGLINY